MNPLAIGAYLVLVALYVVPVIILIKRRSRSSRPTRTQGDSTGRMTSENAPVDGLVATLPVDRW
ncbi:MAG TPA: hypothetical protein VMW11_03290 [Candidatus Dormibacteraeota bacterium]|nr:hypothetical protein [Candidatus Dormibacteraeota bacterium]